MTGFDLSTATNITIGGTQVSAVYLGNNLIWPTGHNYSRDYLTIESLEDYNTISWKAGSANLLKTISISTDDGYTWTSKESSTSGTTLATLDAGNKLLIKGFNTAYANSSNSNYFTATANFNVEGNIMSLIYGDNFVGQTTLDSAGYNLKNLFQNCNKLISARNLILPATSLTRECYENMFIYCTALTSAPGLPATTLTNSCYYGMFAGCTSLTTAPELPATTLTDGCYSSMFNGCRSLNYVKCLATDISASWCTNSWLNNVAASGTFVKNVSMTNWTTGVHGIPNGWTVVNAS